MKKIIITIIATVLPLMASADAVEIDGISYSLNMETKEAEVSNCLNKDVKTVTILEKVVYDDVTYSVTTIGESAFYDLTKMTSITIPDGVTSIGRLAFCGCQSLNSITLPSSLSSIDSQAFYISGIRAITIPQNVTSIGSRVFGGCDRLLSIKVESGNPKYDSRYNCNAIIETSSNTLIVGCRNTIIPDNVTSIGSNAFFECRGLTFILIPNSVTSIGNGAFDNCRDLASVVIGNSVTSIGEGAFYCPLTSLIMETEDPPSLGFRAITSTIYNSASLIVPVGSKMTYQSANGWSSFENIKESNEFDLTGMEFTSEGIRYRIGENNTASVFSVLISDGAIIQKYSGDIVIPDQVTLAGKSYSVTSIEEKAFYSLFGIISVTIGNNVTSIGNMAFSDCFDLRSVTIGSSVTSIGDAAFEWNSKLNFVNIPNSLTSIGIYAFAESGLRYVISELEDPFAVTNNVFKGTSPKLIVPKGAKVNYQNAEGWKNLTIVEDGDVGSLFEVDGVNYERGMNNTASITCHKIKYSGIFNIPEQISYMGNKYSVISIASFAFYQCKDLTSVTIPNSVTSIGHAAFAWCDALTSVTIPSNVKSIDGWAFRGCTGLSTVTIPSSVMSISNNAFSWNNLSSVIVEDGNQYFDSRNNCNAIIETKSNTLITGCKNTIIPNSVTSIGCQAFSHCEGLTSMTIPNSVTSIGDDAFEFCYGLTSLKIPSSVSSIGDGAFYACHNLTSLMIPVSVITIGGMAFGSCSGLTSITIPSTVTSIGKNAFAWCHGLAITISEIENPFKIDNNVFEEVPTEAQLVVPKGTKTKYQEMEGWNIFTNIIEKTGVNGDANNDGVVNEADLNESVSFIMSKTPVVFIRSAADINGDNKIDVADIVLINNTRKKN